MIDWKPASEPPTETKQVLGWFPCYDEGYAAFVWWLNGEGLWAPPGISHWADVEPPNTGDKKHG